MQHGQASLPATVALAPSLAPRSRSLAVVNTPWPSCTTGRLSGSRSWNWGNRQVRHSWFTFFRRMASVFLVGGATAWSSAVCYAQLAADNATDPVYADGWQQGDNGGFG